jgi:stage V sporulation protein B
MSKFLKGTFILLIAGLVTRVLGFINRIVIARFIGEEGVGLYMMAFPTMMLVVTITQLGLPVAISKHVAEAEAKGDFRKIKKILVVSLATTISLSIIFTPALVFLAPYLSETLFTDQRTQLPLLAIAPIVPIVAISSVLRGYFQGRQNMRPSAISQVIEQLVRITLIAVLTRKFMPYGIEYAAAAAMVASVLGELISLLYLMMTFKLRKKFRLRKNFFQFVHSGKSTFNELMSIALPITGSRLIGNVSWFFEPIVVAHSLAIAGVAAVEATKQYGALTGFAMPLLLLPSFITYSLSTSLVPAISEANSKKQTKRIEHLLQQSLRFSLLTGGLSVVVLYVLAEPLMTLMYGTSNGSQFIKLMAPFFLFYYFQGPLQAALQALDLARAAMINSLIGNLAKTAVIFLLASQPAFGINGAALGMVMGIVLITLLHFATMLKTITFIFYVMDYVKIFTIIVIAGLTGYTVLEFMNTSIAQTAGILITAGVITFVYIISAFVFGLIKKQEVVRVLRVFTSFFKKPLFK